jgi:hypothetical protein
MPALKSLTQSPPVLAAAILAALVLAAAGCGGSGTPSAQEQWANDVCTRVADWQTQMTNLANSAQDDISSPDAGLVASLKVNAQKAVDATKQLGQNLKSLPPAPGENGQTAKGILDSFTSDVTRTVDSLQSDLGSLTGSSSAGAVVQVLSGAAADVAAVVAKARSTLDSIQESAGDLKQGFQDAKACKDLQKSIS